MRLLVHDSWHRGSAIQDQQRLFEPFAQADNSGSVSPGGAGLGLVISRSLCEMMGGSLQLSSQPGCRHSSRGIAAPGNTCRLQQKPRRRETQSCPSPRHSPLNVLVVDDHPANRLLMCQQLEFLGHRFSVAADGEAGLGGMERSEPFDLVIADCNMPISNT